MVSDHGARAQPIRLGRELRAEAKFELPKLRGVPYSAADCHTLGRHIADLVAASKARLDGERPWGACRTHPQGSGAEGRSKV